MSSFSNKEGIRHLIEQLGDKNEFTLTIGVDKAWIPAKVIPNSKDDRELGCQISFIYFR